MHDASLEKAKHVWEKPAELHVTFLIAKKANETVQRILARLLQPAIDKRISIHCLALLMGMADVIKDWKQDPLKDEPPQFRGE
jgi:hypothetical protein